MKETNNVLNSFEKAIQLDHLTKEQIDELLKILSK
jgi:hypothetical protein